MGNRGVVYGMWSYLTGLRRVNGSEQRWWSAHYRLVALHPRQAAMCPAVGRAGRCRGPRNADGRCAGVKTPDFLFLQPLRCPQRFNPPCVLPGPAHSTAAPPPPSHTCSPTGRTPPQIWLPRSPGCPAAPPCRPAGSSDPTASPTTTGCHCRHLGRGGKRAGKGGTGTKPWK